MQSWYSSGSNNRFVDNIMRLPAIILASGSPRRRDLLRSLGWEFNTVVPDIKEEISRSESAEDAVKRLAVEKISKVAASFPEALVIAADTVVVVDGCILEKPSDTMEAEKMLEILAGREHEVITGVAVSFRGRTIVEREITEVEFRELDAHEISAYVKTGEGRDKAGSYAIQNKGSLLVKRITGCYFNVVGLPLFLLSSMLKTMGIGLPAQWEVEE